MITFKTSTNTETHENSETVEQKILKLNTNPRTSEFTGISASVP